jgi:hypothetical protein
LFVVFDSDVEADFDLAGSFFLKQGELKMKTLKKMLGSKRTYRFTFAF